MSFIKSLFRCCSPTKRTKQYDIVLENEKNNNNQSANKLIEQLLPNSKKKTKTETETENKLPNEENERT